MPTVIKQRIESLELILLRFLSYRMKLSDIHANNLSTLEKGYRGELIFDEYFKDFSDDWRIIIDLLLEYNQTHFQTDSLAKHNEILYLFDVKNYEGDYFIGADNRWYSRSSGKEIKNPLEQLKRCESLLRRLLHDLGYNITIESYLIFVNPEFHLYNASMDLPIIYPTQLNRFLTKLRLKSSMVKERFPNLLEKLLSLNMTELPNKRLPQYSYEQLEKGIICCGCHSIIMHTVGGGDLVCKCGYKEDFTKAVLRSVEEYRLLFPDRKITTNDIYEWCGGFRSKKVIRRVLAKNFRAVSRSIHTYYVDI